MGRKFIVAFVLVGLGACGGGSKSTGTPPGSSDSFTEGSRLKARWMQAPGAPRTLAGWYDSQLGVNCSFTSAYYNNSFARPDGGDFYCMPELSSGTGDLFADSACTQPVAGVDCPSRLAELPGRQPSCDAVDRFFSVGDALNDATVFQSADGICTALSLGDAERPPSPYKLGAEIGVTAFVHAHLTNEAGSARIARRMLTADDGSSQVWGAWDATRGEGVYPPDWAIPATGIGPGKWEPERVVDKGNSYGLFADASCSVLAAEFPACGAVTVKSMFQRTSSECRDAATYYEAGPMLTAAQIYQTYPDPSGACLAYPSGSTPQDTAFVTLGALILPSSFADVRSVEEGTDRVRLHAAGTDAGAVGGPYAYYFDTQNGEMCSPALAADDTLRCLPVFTAAPNLFSEAGCHLPLFAWSPGPSSCPAALPSMVNLADVVSVDPCGATVYRNHVRPVGGAFVGNVWTLSADGQSCDRITPDVQATLNTYELGAELPAGNFVALTTSTPF